MINVNKKNLYTLNFLLILLLIASNSLCMNINKINISQDGMSERTKDILIRSTIVAGGTAVVLVMTGPIIVPIATAITIKASGGAAAIKVGATTAAVGKAMYTALPITSLITSGIKISISTKKYFYPSMEQKVQRLWTEKLSAKSFEEELKLAEGMQDLQKK